MGDDLRGITRFAARRSRRLRVSVSDYGPFFVTAHLKEQGDRDREIRDGPAVTVPVSGAWPRNSAWAVLRRARRRFHRHNRLCLLPPCSAPTLRAWLVSAQPAQIAEDGSHASSHETTSVTLMGSRTSGPA